MKIYVGLRTPEECSVYVWDTSRPRRPEILDPALQLWNHSPDGFQWGYCGSGPAQLALALLYDVSGDADWAVSMHQSVKSTLVARQTSDLWALSEQQILSAALAVARTPEARAQCEQQLLALGQRIAAERSTPSVTT